MTDRIPLPELGAEQMAQVDKGIEQLGEFLSDVLPRPEIVVEIPSGSSLAFHTLAIAGDQRSVRLTAFREKNSEGWSVRATGIGDQESSPDDPCVMPDWILSILPLMQNATWESPDDAFAAIEEALQRASGLHLLAG